MNWDLFSRMLSLIIFVGILYLFAYFIIRPIIKYFKIMNKRNLSQKQYYDTAIKRINETPQNNYMYIQNINSHKYSMIQKVINNQDMDDSEKVTQIKNIIDN
ncbi:MAG TPA: hypothetical protein DCY81_03330 [Lachnospiraceae bacterium]|nr:hypothetical protein [Lachnospiraceae bacterium]